MKRRDSWGMLAALVHVPFLLLWSGALVSNVGNWMESVSQSWLVWDQGHSTIWSGVLPFAGLVPCAILALPMGVVADRADRRKLLLVFQLLMTAAAALMAVAAHAGWTQPGVVVGIALLGGIAGGAGAPVWHALVPELIPREDLGKAIALNSLQFNVARVAGPVLAALVIERWGVARAFDLNVASFALVIVALVVMRVPPRKDVPAPRVWTVELAEATRIARGHRGIWSLIVLGALFLAFASPVFALLPALSEQLLLGKVGLYSTLLSAIGAGAVFGALLMGRVATTWTRQRAMGLAALLVAGTLVGLASSRDEHVAHALLFTFGVGWCILLTTQHVALQHLCPDAMRGRIMSLNIVAILGVGPLGQLVSGFLAKREALGLPETLALMAAGVVAVGVWQLAFVEPAVEGYAPETPRLPLQTLAPKASR